MNEIGALFNMSVQADATSLQATTTDDAELAEVVEWFRGQENLERRFADVFRQSLDEVLDGQRTGRFDIEELSKTEKTYLGTKVEIVVRAAFELPPGDRMDYKVQGHDVDAKFSLRGDWAIPREALNHICLLLHANDRKRIFDVGLIRIRPELLNKGSNQDGKKTLTKSAKTSITWLFRDAALPPNLLLSLPIATRETIFGAGSGQKRINELLRHVRGVLIDRNTAVTVAMQQDGMKRCRDARKVLSREGIAVLGHQNDSPKIAQALELPVPPKGNFIAVRLVRVPDGTNDRPTALIAGDRYAVTESDEPTAPLPSIRY
ncbi:NaeI family type II restriction endonuclease [Nocardia donostiensis]|uniref:NaeI family type II restriction endonuclease n=1 Tax=Nocardia donostiensis TaxID=1538463 RepID=UPI0011156456|nr:NaeI family type II restriction endonuclease [Nocardia donostiensis]